MALAQLLLLSAVAAPVLERAAPAPAAMQVCPPVATQGDFNLDEWIRASWYIQQQQLNDFQQPDDLFCVMATYEAEGREVPGFDGTVISVYNYANRGAVNGPGTDPEQEPLCARLIDPSEPSNSIVNAPCFLPNLLGGPYWVVAAGPSPERYTWGVLSGGQPGVPGADGGCSNTEEGQSGFWLFSRTPIISEADLEDIRTVARMNGFSLDLLRTVPHQDQTTGERCE